MENNLTCSSCNYEVSDHDNYCGNCGNSLSLGSRDNSQKLLFAAITVLFGTAFYWFFLELVVSISGSYELYDTLHWFGVLIGLAGVSVALLIALAMKKGSMRSLAIVFASIWTFIDLFWLVKRTFPGTLDFF
ncbi:MAG: hypothetical protein ACI837_003186 [Crocinitomicaceae bacterium]|jgi:hypothetical protein